MSTTEELHVYLAVTHGNLTELSPEQERTFTLLLGATTLRDEPEKYFFMLEKAKSTPRETKEKTDGG